MADIKHQIKLTLEGLPSEQGHVLASDFLRELQSLIAALHRTDITDNGISKTETTYYRVVNLSHSSPATVTLEARSYSDKIDARGRILDNFYSNVVQIRDGKLDKRIDYSFLEDLRNIANPVGRTIAKAQIEVNGKTVSIDREYRINIDKILAPEETYPGTIRGMLETINLHGGANVFRIYPDVGPTKVTCHFPAELEVKAINAVTHFVEVKGIIYYKSAAQYAHKVDVKDLLIYPSEDDLPTLNDLRGVAPKATGDKLSEEFIWGLRNGK